MNILLTSVGRRTYIVKYFQEALGSEGLVHAANSECTLPLQVADRGVVTPLICSHEYVDFLVKYCVVNEIDVLLSLFDVDLPVLAANRNAFEEKGVRMLISGERTIRLCRDKWRCHNFLRGIGLHSPETYLTVSDCLDDLDAERMSFPLVIKPRWGTGSIGIYDANTISELETLYVKSKDRALGSYLKYESSLDPDRCVIVQEKLTGQEYGLDVFNDLEGSFLACVPKRKIAMRAGETDSAVTIDNPLLQKIGKQLATSLNHVGNLDVDCIESGGQYYILDLNCRFGGQYPFSHLAGADFPRALLKMINGDIVAKEWLRAKSGVVGTKDLLPRLVKEALQEFNAPVGLK